MNARLLGIFVEGGVGKDGPGPADAGTAVSFSLDRLTQVLAGFTARLSRNNRAYSEKRTVSGVRDR